MLKVPSLPLEQGRQLRKRTIPLTQSQIDAPPPELPPLPINTDDQGYILASDKQLESEGMSSDTANDVKRFLDIAAKELNDKGSQLESNAHGRDNESYTSPVSMVDLSLQVLLDTPSTAIPLPTLPIPPNSKIPSGNFSHHSTPIMEQTVLDNTPYPPLTGNNILEQQYEIPKVSTVNANPRLQAGTVVNINETNMTPIFTSPITTPMVTKQMGPPTS